MEFSCFIKKIRTELSLSQNEMVDKLASGHSQFYNLNTTTYNRWENNHTTPSTLKISLISKILNLNLIEFYRSLDLKLSKSKIKSFQDLMDCKESSQSLFRLLSPTVPDHEVFQVFNRNNISKDIDLINRVKGSMNNFMRQCSTTIGPSDASHFITMHEAGNIVIPACIDSANETYSAHGAWFYAATSLEKSSLQAFKNKDLRIKNLKLIARDQDFFAFVLPPSLHSNAWWQFFISELIKDIITRSPVRIYIVCLSVEVLKLHLAIGFETVHSISNTININSNIDDEKNISTTYLAAIDYDVLISHHGVIDFIQKSNLFN